MSGRKRAKGLLSEEEEEEEEGGRRSAPPSPPNEEIAHFFLAKERLLVKGAFVMKQEMDFGEPGSARATVRNVTFPLSQIPTL